MSEPGRSTRARAAEHAPRWAALVVILALSPSPALAQHVPRLQWSDDWARVHPAAYVAEGVAVAISLAVDNLFEPGPEARLRGPILLDGDVSAVLAAPTREAREVAASVSDGLLAALVAWPAFVDGILVAGLLDLNSDVAWQLAMISAETVAADFLLSTLVKIFVHRERPHGQRCRTADRLLDPDRCGARGRTRSFYSGHASGAFNAAGTVCVTHAYLPLYGGVAADAFACGAALLSATVISILRVVAARHYLSDVLVGAMVGALTGALLPFALHFAWDPTPDVGARPEPLSPVAPRTTYVPIYGGVF